VVSNDPRRLGAPRRRKILHEAGLCAIERGYMMRGKRGHRAWGLVSSWMFAGQGPDGAAAALGTPHEAATHAWVFSERDQRRRQLSASGACRLASFASAIMRSAARGLEEGRYVLT